MGELSKGGWWAWSTKKKVLIFGGIAFIIIALGVGLGAGLGIGLKGGDDDNDNGSGSDSGTGTNTTTPTNTTVKWQPAVGVKWQIVLRNPVNDTSVAAPVYDLDLFDNDASVISELQGLGRKVICYFSAGTYENWRVDASEFDKADLGSNLDDWPGERWVNVKATKIRKIMQERLDLAVKKGCDGVDPDNIDGYDNDNGLGLTQAQAINYVNWLASESHSRGLSIGLKNGGAIIDSVIDNMQWCVNEQCAQYDECDTYAAFIKADKPVFHIEYPKGADTNNNKDVTTKQVNSACTASSSGNFSTVIKNMNLNNWVEYC